MSNIYNESLSFHPEKEDGSCHIFCPSKLQIHAQRTQFLGTVDLGPRAQFTELDDHSGNKMISTTATKTIQCADDLNYDFNGCTVKNFVTEQLASTATTNTFNTASIQPTMIATCNPTAGYAHLDAEIDALTVSTNNALTRTQGFTTNKILRSNGAGLIEEASFDTDKCLRNDLNTQQAVNGDINLASGKRIKYDGVAVELSSSAKLNTDLSNIGSAVVPEANIHPSITRDTEVSQAVQDDLDLKLDLNLSNIGNSVIPEANIHPSITRDNEVSTAVIGELTGKMNTGFSNIANGAVLAEANVHADIARVAATVPKAGGTFSGSVHMFDGVTMPTSKVIERTVTISGTEFSTEYCKSQGCVLGATPSSNNDQSIAGTKTLTDSQPLNLSALTASRVVVLDGSKNVTTSADNLVSAGDLAKIQALPSVADINTLAHTNDAGETIFQNPVGTNEGNGNLAVLDGSEGMLYIGTNDDNSRIVFDGGIATTGGTLGSDGSGFTISNVSQTCNIDTNVNVETGKKYKISGADLNFSHLAGTVADSQISTVTGSKVSGDIPVASVPSGLSAGLVTTGTFDSARIPSLDGSKIGSGTLATARLPATVMYNTDDIEVPADKHIYRAIKQFVGNTVASSNRWITIAVCPVSSFPNYSWSNTTFSILDIGRKCFGRFTIGIFKGSHTITVDTYVASQSSGGNLGIAKMRIRANSSYGDSSHRQGALLQIFSRHSDANYTIYEHAAGNYIDTGFSLVEPVEHSTTQTDYTQISTNSSISVSSPSGFSTVDEVPLESFIKDYTPDHTSATVYEGDFMTRNGGNAYFKRRIVMESTAEDIYQTHANAGSLSNGVFTRLAAIENGKDYTANTIRLPNSNSRLSVQLNTTNGTALAVGGGNTNCNIWQVSSGNGTGDLSHYGFSCRYMGAGTGNNNSLRLYADNQGSTEKVAYEVLQDGNFIIHQEIYKTGAISSGDGIFERVDALDTPTWTALTVGSGMTAGAGGTNSKNRMEYVVSNERVYIRGYIEKTNGANFATGDVLFTLPSTIRPKFSFEDSTSTGELSKVYFHGTNEGGTGVGEVRRISNGAYDYMYVNIQYYLD